MIFPKILITGGISTAILVGGIVTYFNMKPTEYHSPEFVQTEYTDFLQKLQDPALQTKLAASCDTNFNQQIQNLQDEFKQLQAEKDNIKLSESSEDVDYGDLDLKPGQQVPDLGEPESSEDVDYGDLNLKPGQQVPDLGDPVKTESEEYIPRPGEQVPDLGEPESSEDVDYGDLNLKPGQQPLDMVEPKPESIEKILNTIDVIGQDIMIALNVLQKSCDGTKIDCFAACTNYVNKCLSLVPNAGTSLLKQGMDSCLQECKKRDTAKIQCIAQAPRCEPMTDTCGL